MLPSHGWQPQNLIINSNGGLVPVAGTPYFQQTGTTTVDFGDVIGATHYVLFMCPKRFTKDATVQGILNHYPSCGTKQTWATPVSYFEMLNTISVMPGDEYVCFIAAYDATGYSYSSVFEFKGAGESTYSQVLGNMEYCTTSGSLPAPIPITTPQTKPKKK